MSRNQKNLGNNYYHHHRGKPPIIVHENDVLSGRGVNIAHHTGNQRFRSLVTSRADENYCTTYTASEKRAVAEDIIRHIHDLNPPGRFLRRDGRGHVSRGLNGPWEELTEREAIKKTCQALRDCNRSDRNGYADGVVPPVDVIKSVETMAKTGLTRKQHAEAAAATKAAKVAEFNPLHNPTLKRTRDEFDLTPQSHIHGLIHDGPGVYHPASLAAVTTSDDGRVSPSVENAAEWLKKQRTDHHQTSNHIMDTAALEHAAFSTVPSHQGMTDHTNGMISIQYGDHTGAYHPDLLEGTVSTPAPSSYGLEGIGQVLTASSDTDVDVNGHQHVLHHAASDHDLQNDLHHQHDRVQADIIATFNAEGALHNGDIPSISQAPSTSLNITEL